MKVLHTADWHFREKDHDEIEKCVRHIVACAWEHMPDLICISGDITDSRMLKFDSRSARTIFSIVSEFMDIAPVAIVIGTPSHDGLSALALDQCRGEYPILVSDKPGQYGYYHGVDGDSPYIGWRHSINAGYLSPSLIITQLPQPTKQFLLDTDMQIDDADKALGQAMGTILAGS